MSNIKKLLFTIVIFIAFSYNVNATTTYTNFGGNGVRYNSFHGSCNDTTYNYTPCNNLNFLALNVQLVYYNKKHTYEYIDNVIVTNSYWGTDHIPHAKKWSNLGSTTSINYQHSNFDQELKNFFKKESNQRDVLSLMGRSYDKLVAKIKSGGYPDHEILGSDGISSTGVRLIIEPIYTYKKKKGNVFYGSVRDIAEKGLLDSNNINKKYLANYANALYFEKDDIGIRKGSFFSKDAAHFFTTLHSSKNSYGRSEVAIYDKKPDDKKKKLCDPDPDKDGAKTCCDVCTIKSKNSTNNTTKKGCLQRKITENEYEKYCAGDSRCNPDTEGVKTCCSRCSVSDKNINNRKDTTCLKRAITESEVKNYCSKPKAECNYTLKVDTSDDCYEKTTGIISDGDDEENPWKCVFRSQYNGYSEVRSHYNPTRYGSTSNSYCRISCKEDISYDFPRYGVSVEHGRFLVVEDSTIYPSLWPISYKFKKECRTSSPDGYTGKIDYDRFKRDMENNEDWVEYHWNQYRIYETKQDACNSATEVGRSYYTDKKTGITTVTIYYEGSASYRGNTYWCSYTNHSWPPSYWSDITYHYSEYNYYSGYRRESLISEINSCSNNDATEYMSMDLDLDFDADIYDGNYKLIEKSPSYYRSNKYYTSGNSIDGNGSYSYGRPYDYVKVRYCYYDNYCQSYDYRYYYSPTWVQYNYEQDSEYRLESNVNKYVSKYSGQSYSDPDDAGDNYITIPTANLPIHYSANTGLYKFQININKISTSNKFYPYLYNKNTFAGDKYRIDDEYTCKYRVTGNKVNTVVGPLVYREIPLTTNNYGQSLAFLSRTGNIRRPGTNWNQLNYVSQYITNNRNVRGNNVYKLKPMYEITLTPNLIRNIREYNKRQNSNYVTIYGDSNKEKVGVLGYSNVDELECENGTNCKSTVLRDSWGVTGCIIDGTCH